MHPSVPSLDAAFACKDRRFHPGSIVPTAAFVSTVDQDTRTLWTWLEPKLSSRRVHRKIANQRFADSFKKHKPASGTIGNKIVLASGRRHHTHASCPLRGNTGGRLLPSSSGAATASRLWWPSRTISHSRRRCHSTAGGKLHHFAQAAVSHRQPMMSRGACACRWTTRLAPRTPAR
mgnify:CR=1 FL=1